MQDNLGDTQPLKPKSDTIAGDTQPIRANRRTTAPISRAASEPQQSAGDKYKRNKPIPIWLWALLVALILIIVAALGGTAGYLSGKTENQAAATAQAQQAVQAQYQLALQDVSQGRFEIARQRFEYVLSENPGYPDAASKLAQVIAIIYATATPTPTTPPPTITPSPTHDPRPIQDLFAKAATLLANSQWSNVLDTLTALRKENLSYEAPQVDGMLYLAFRSRGIEKILQEGNLQGGVYDLSLAERFGPLDVEANTARTWARIYMIGTSFWEAYPQQAVYYFGQIAAAAPGLHDSSGWTALERYRGALIQYGDQLANQGSWCEAQAQYELAISIRGDEKLLQLFSAAQEQCTPPTATFTLTPTATLPYTLTVSPSPTDTSVIVPSETPTPTATIPVDTPTPTETTPPPTETPTPPEAPPPPAP